MDTKSKDWESLRVITCKELRSFLPDTDDIVDFSGLEFYRVKQRGENLFQVEFGEGVCRSLRTGLVEIENAQGPRSMRSVLPGIE
jgi:hypothetical protein